MKKRQWIVYLIRCSDESLYCGITNNLKKRLIAHNSGRGSKYTRSRRPIEFVDASFKMTKSDALKLEYRIKQVPADKKIFELINEEINMTKKLKKDLQSVNKDLKALAKKVDGIIIAIDKLEKPKATKKPKVKPTKGKAVKKTLVKKTTVKKAVSATAADIVLGIIDAANKSVNTATLMKKTRFTEKKIANLLYKLKKQGKIKRVGKGVYVKA